MIWEDVAENDGLGSADSGDSSCVITLVSRERSWNTEIHNPNAIALCGREYRNR